jgi:hypothetical protein
MVKLFKDNPAATGAHPDNSENTIQKQKRSSEAQAFPLGLRLIDSLELLLDRFKLALDCLIVGTNAAKRLNDPDSYNNRYPNVQDSDKQHTEDFRYSYSSHMHVSSFFSPDSIPVFDCAELIFRIRRQGRAG